MRNGEERSGIGTETIIDGCTVVISRSKSIINRGLDFGPVAAKETGI